MTPEKSWGMAVAALDRETFRKRVYRCTDAGKLRAAATHEHKRAGETREERIARINQRIQKLK